MNRFTCLPAIAIVILSFGLSTAGAAVEKENLDRCLAPFFEIKGGETSIERFPLRKTETRVTIAGVIAEVTVTQIYANTGSETIEAKYLFPASTRAAIHGMSMTIGDRRVSARIEEKKKAKENYKKAKAANQSAALLEQKRPNVFEMNVANILPGDEVKVTLNYSEQLRPEEAIYEFVYPTVVGPRYSNRTADSPDAPDHSWVQNPYLNENALPAPAGFDFQLDLKAGMPIQTLTCTSHEARIAYQGKEKASLSVDGNDATNRDVIVRYRLADDQINSGLLLHEGEKENFFLLNVQPPARVQPDHIPPREYLFVIDVSGSMGGFPLDLAKDLFRDLMDGLRPEDSFNVLAFAGSSAVLAPQPLPANRQNIARGLHFLNNMNGGGGTELVKALKNAINLPGKEDHSRSILVITDGYVSMEPGAFELIQEKRGRANLFAFGIGSSVNRHLIEGLAKVGLGEPFIVTEPSEAGPVARRLREYISSPVLTNIKIQDKGIELRETEPGSLPDVFAARPVTLTGKWSGKAQGTIRITGKTGGGETFAQEFSLAEAARSGTDNPALRALWARERVRTLADYAGRKHSKKKVKEVTRIGLAYSLMTPYTSFVAVDERIREIKGEKHFVQQPLPLPKGVGKGALGGGQPNVQGMGAGSLIVHSMGSSNATIPEPGTGTLILFSLLALTFIRRR
ncbi:MAG: VIT and VWA domain-containing protein [Verrucomicrobiota bacterium]